MVTNKYKGNHTLVWVTGVGCVLLMILGYFERGFDAVSLYALLIGLSVTAFIYWTAENTYIAIRDKRTLLNNGYREFGHDEIDIYDIKYIYRVPAFPWKSGGSFVVMYVKGNDGKLKHSVFRESNYSNENLKAVLTKLKTLNPSIELDPEYEDFLSGKLGPQNPWGFNNIGTKNTKKSVEERLRARGETW